jgi:hypothetical protein
MHAEVFRVHARVGWGPDRKDRGAKTVLPFTDIDMRFHVDPHNQRICRWALRE